MYFAKSQIHLAAEVYQKLTVQPDAASSSVNRVEGDLLQAFIDSEGNDDDESVGHVDDNAVPLVLLLLMMMTKTMIVITMMMTMMMMMMRMMV